MENPFGDIDIGNVERIILEYGESRSLMCASPLTIIDGIAYYSSEMMTEGISAFCLKIIDREFD